MRPTFFCGRALMAILLLCAALVAVVPSANAAAPPAAVERATATGGAVPSALNIKDLDLHDGHLAKVGGTYYLYGTQYSCGFEWSVADTPWCGFGVSTAPTSSGPWSKPRLLFSPQDIDPWTGTTWLQECGSTGNGCFNPRMFQRSGWGADDQVFVLWFNSPVDFNRDGSNAYNVMGCNGPAGPCGPSAGAPNGSYHKPALHICVADGDFGIVQNPHGAPAIMCTMPGSSTLSIERIDAWGANGTGEGADDLAGLSEVESPGAYQDEASGKWILTYSDPNCGYCTGTGTGYAIADNMFGPYTAPENLGVSAPEYGRRVLSATSCGGQPRTVSMVGGQAWEGIDLWTGSLNETNATLHFEPLIYIPSAAEAGDGEVWQPPFSSWSCR